MSLIVLNSRGQDPAEFENHGFNLKLGRDTQFCLCGTNLNRPPKTPLQLAVTAGSNNMWIIANGGKLQNDEHFHAPIAFSVREGVYGIAGMAAEMTYAMNGNYRGDTKENYGGMPISCWRANTADPLTGGLQITSAGAVGAEKYSAICSMTKIINGMRTRKRSIVGCLGGEEFPDSGGVTDGLIPNGIPGPNQILTNTIDGDYIDVTPSNSCKNFICMDPLWNTSNDARAGVFSGDGPIPADGSNDGYTWSHRFTAADSGNIDQWIGKIRGGIVSSKWTGGLQAGGTALSGGTNVMGPEAARSRWAVGGTRYDVYWEIGERSNPATGINIRFYAADMRKDRNYKNNIATDIMWGELSIPQITLQAQWWEICIRPIQVTGANPTYRLEAWARSKGLPGPNGPQVGAAIPATAGGAVGYYAIDEGANALYQNLPMFQALTFREAAPVVGTWSLRSIHHNERPPTAKDPNDFGAATELTAFTSTAAAINNALKITCMFSPTAPNFQRNPLGGGPTSTNPLRYDCIEMGHRRTGIAPVLGFKIGDIQEMPEATTATIGVEGEVTSRSFEASEPVAVIQLPNIPLHGELGSGSTIWGGSNGGQVLGVAQIDDKGSYANYNLGMNVYTEPGLENWVDCGNLGVDALNQLKVKITDQQGRKLVGLYPDTTIWLKVRSKTQGSMRTGGNDHRGQENRSSW